MNLVFSQYLPRGVPISTALCRVHRTPASAEMVSRQEEFRATLFGILLWIPYSISYVPLFLFWYAIYHLVQFSAKIFHPQLIPISKCDALVTPGPSNGSFGYMYDCQIWKVRGLLEVNQFRNHFYQCFLSTEEDRQKYRNLYCYFVEYLGYIFKKPVNEIDLNFYIHVHHLNEGESVESFAGNWMVTHDNVAQEKLLSEANRPTWMIELVPNLSREETTVLFKLHHGLADGYTMVHLVDKLSGQQSPYLFKEPVPSLSERIKILIRSPYMLFKIWREMYLLRKDNPKLTEDDDSNGKEKWLISLGTLDLETVKSIRRFTGTSFATVLMSVQIGALRRLLEEMKPNARILKYEPSTVSIGHSMGWPEHPVPLSGGGMTNHVTITSIKAGFNIRDPFERLQNVHSSFTEMKSMGYPSGFYYDFMNGMKHFPACATRQMVRLDLSIFAQENGLSTLLGSPNQHFLLGHQVENIWLPVVIRSFAPALRLMVVPFSHSGILDVSVNAEMSFIKSQENLDRFLKVHFVQELEALRIRCQCPGQVV